jgi:hypothetical protein
LGDAAVHDQRMAVVHEHMASHRKVRSLNR